jgi:antitoxin component of MazEF toxin-antitoxin module
VKVVIRRIGNSLGVIIPKPTLAAWGLREGGHLELSDAGIRPTLKRANSHERLDELKRKLAVAVVARFTSKQIRAHSLANLQRWKQNGSWVSAYDEWERILTAGGDGELFLAMLGRDERSNRLRQSPPYVGLLPRDEVERLNEEACEGVGPAVRERIKADIVRNFAQNSD